MIITSKWGDEHYIKENILLCMNLSMLSMHFWISERINKISLQHEKKKSINRIRINKDTMNRKQHKWMSTVSDKTND